MNPDTPILFRGNSGSTSAVDTVDPELMREIDRYILRWSTAENTKIAYRNCWRVFVGWCESEGHGYWPAHTNTVVAFIKAASQAVVADGQRWRYAPSSLAQMVAAINKIHSLGRLSKPGQDDQVKELLSSIRKHRIQQPIRSGNGDKRPLLLTHIHTIVQQIHVSADRDPTRLNSAYRDTAMILLAFGGALRRSELVAFNIEDVELHPEDGLHMRLRSSKTDQEGEGQTKGIGRGNHLDTCAPCAFLRWRWVLECIDGDVPTPSMPAYGEDHVCRFIRVPRSGRSQLPLFRVVNKSGRVGAARLGGHGANSMMKRRLIEAGFDPDRYGFHSFRVGFVTQSYRNGATDAEVARQTGHRTRAMLERYHREHAPLQGNAVTKLGM